MRRPGPQRETGTPASGPSTDPTPPFQHTPSPRTGGCRRPGPRGRWTRRVTVTASAPRKTQVGPARRLVSPGDGRGPNQRLRELPLPVRVTFRGSGYLSDRCQYRCAALATSRAQGVFQNRTKRHPFCRCPESQAHAALSRSSPPY